MTELLSEVHDITSRSQWLDLRRQDVTASRVGALFDAHPYLTREQLAGTLLGTHNEGDTPAMRRGRILEPAVAAALAEEHPGWRITKATTYHRLPVPRLGATPDYWYVDDDGRVGVCQCKTTSPETWEKWHGRVPLAYTLQVLLEMMCTGREHGLIALMVTSRSLPLYEFPVARHPAAEAKILAAATAWWQAFDRGEIAPAAAVDDLETLTDDGSTIDLSADNWLSSALPERSQLKAEIAEREKRVGEIDEYLRTRMGLARYGHLPGWVVTWRSYQRKERLQPAGTFRRLLVASAKEEETC